MLVSTVASVLIYSSPASSPGPPKMSAIAAPTSAELAGRVASRAATCCIIWNVVALPSRRACCTASDDMPMPSSAACVAGVSSRRRMLASLMASTPLSENTPCRAALVVMATNASALMPASLK